MKSFFFINIVLFLSIFSLLFVFILQYEYGILPCKICIWQRWPHIFNIFIALIIISSSSIPNYIMVLGLINMFLAFILALYHYGLEQNLWDNVFSCSGEIKFNGLSTEEILKNLNNTPIKTCEIEAWNFLNLSLTGWNMILTIFISLIWFLLIYYQKRSHESNSASQ